MANTFSFAQKKNFALEQFKSESGAVISETTPSVASDAVGRFSQTLSSEPWEVVPVVPDVQYGLYGWCSDGVLEKISHDGGSIVFGWTIWEWPKVMLTAEFHAVWENPAGARCDITPKPQGEQAIVFVPDHRYPTDFDFDERPRNRRFRLYPDQDVAALVAAKMSKMNRSQIAYEQRRALHANCSLDEWISKKGPKDPLPQTIDRFIDVCAAHEAKLDSLGPAGEVIVDRELHGLIVSKVSLLNQIQSSLKRMQ